MIYPDVRRLSSAVWLFVAVLAAPASGRAQAQAAADPGPTAARVDALLSRLTAEDKVKLMHPQGFMETIPVLDFKPSILNDGPMGVRNTVSTAFPSPICMGGTWDPALLFQVTAALGSEAKSFKNTMVQLGPMINLIRHPNGGRNFEMFGEDPFLVGSLGVAYVRGLQSEKVGACPKHMACNEQETDRKGVDVRIDDRTLHEVYLLPFEMAVKQADPWFIMTGYNKVNGVECYRNRYLLQDVARDQWHYRGAFCSDWTAVQDAVGAVNAGLNLDLNSAMAYTTKLPGLVKSGEVSEAKIDELVRPILRTYVLSGLLDGDRPGEINTPAHHELARKVAEEGIVLLKNKGLLPLRLDSIHRIAVFGPNADVAHCTGGGSGGVRPAYEITPLAGLRRFCGSKVEVVAQPYQGAPVPIPATAFSHPDGGQPSPGLVAKYYNGKTPGGEAPALTRTDAQLAFNWIDNSPAQGVVDNAVFAASWKGELVAPIEGGYTLSVAAKGDYSVSLNGKKIISTAPADHCDHQVAQVRLAAGEAAQIEATFLKTKSDASFTLNWEIPTPASDAGKLAASADVAVVVIGTSHRDEAEGWDRSFWNLPAGQADLIQAVARANPKTIVVMVGGSPLEVASWQDDASALVEMWYAGMEGGNALADILFGKVNPSGKLPVTIPRKLEDVGSEGHFATAKTVDVPEGVFVGYRHFDKAGIEPLYPFGYGLSYTTFGYADLAAKVDAGQESVTFRVTNTGSVAGTEIAQVYTGAGPGPVERPVRELQGFARVELQPGESKTVTVPLPPTAFAFYDVDKKAWHTAKGAYVVEVGGSSRSLPLKTQVDLPESVIP